MVDERVLLVFSIDFSHFLPPREAKAYDRVTEEAVLNRDYKKIHSLCNHYVDCPGALIMFLMFLESQELDLYIIDRAEASRFLGFDFDETTSYFVMAGAAP